MAGSAKMPLYMLKTRLANRYREFNLGGCFGGRVRPARSVIICFGGNHRRAEGRHMKAMYPGTFDPFTNGHCDLVRRAARLYERIVVAVAASPGKNTLFDIEQRVALASAALADLDNVEVIAYQGLTVEFARQHDLGVIIRGLRAVSDFEFEFQLASMNRRLAEDIETVFLTPTEQFTFVSSSLVREIAQLGGDVSEFVPAAVGQALSDLKKA